MTKTSDTETITLRRSGQPPLTFTGELLAEADGQRQYGRDWTRWHELRVYHTVGDKYVLAIEFLTRWQGEGDHYTAEVLAGPEAVAATLRAYDPCGHLRGYPDGDAYAERQARLERDLADRYAALVSEVLSSDPAFAEAVE